MTTLYSTSSQTPLPNVNPNYEFPQIPGAQPNPVSYPIYFILLGPGGNGNATCGGGGGSFFYGSFNTVNSSNIWESNLYVSLPNGGSENNQATWFTLNNPIYTPLPDPAISYYVPYCFSGMNGNEGGIGGYWAIANGATSPGFYAPGDITVLDNGNGGDATGTSGGACPITFTSSLAPVNGSVCIGGNPNGYGSNGFVIISSAPLDTYYTKTAYFPPLTNVPCFPKGTTLMTPEGYKAVETLEQGSLVTTAANKVVAIKNIYSRTIQSTNANTAPYLIPKHSFGASPTADLRLSPLHAFQIKKGLWQIPKYAALSDKAIQQYGLGESVTYYHVECPNFFTDNLIVDGTVVESFAANQAKGLKTLYKYNPALNGFTRAAQPSLLTNKTA